MTTPTLNKLIRARVIGFWPAEGIDTSMTFSEGSTDHFSVSLTADDLVRAADEVMALVDFDGEGQPPSTPILSIFEKNRVFSFEVEGPNKFHFEELGTGSFGLTLNRSEMLQLANDFNTLSKKLQPKPPRRVAPR